MSASSVPPIPVDRSWIGAPAGTLRNPTVWLIVLTYAALGLGTWGYLAGGWPAWLAIGVNATAIYVGFTPMHEAVHGVAHERRRVNGLVGRMGALPLTVSLPLFRGVHLAHHAHTNDPAQDPDYVVSMRPRWLLPLWCLGILVSYHAAFYLRRLWRTPGQLAEALVVDAALAATILLSLAGGWFDAFFVVWLGPAMAALVFLAFAFDFVPHYPYDTRARYYDTRIYPGAALNALLLGQNYHLVHHLWTTIPWHRYRRVFSEIEPELARRGCRVGWRVTPLPDGVGSVVAS